MKNRHWKSKLMFGAILLAGMAVHAQDTGTSAPPKGPPAAPSPRDTTTPPNTTQARPLGSDPLGASVPEQTVQMFKSDNFQGDMVQIDSLTSKPQGEPADLPRDLEDSLSALRWNLPSGVVVVFYEDAGGKGEQLAIWGTGEASNVHRFDFNDKATRWAWYYLGGADAQLPNLKGQVSQGPHGAEHTSASVPENSLQLFVDKNFEGTTATIAPLSGQPAGRLHELPKSLPDSVTSLRWNLPPGVIVTFHQDNDGKKQQASIWGSGEIKDIDYWDFNDKISRWSWSSIAAPAVTPPKSSTP